MDRGDGEGGTVGMEGDEGILTVECCARARQHGTADS